MRNAWARSTSPSTPKNPRNRIIVDLDKAPRNAQGEVEFSADLFVLRPTDPSRGNDVLFFDVVNRGNKLLLGRFNLARGSTDPTTEADFGDGFLMREGYTIVALGWEAGPNNPSVSLYPPTATEGGSRFTVRSATGSFPSLQAGPSTLHLPIGAGLKNTLLWIRRIQITT